MKEIFQRCRVPQLDPMILIEYLLFGLLQEAG